MVIGLSACGSNEVTNDKNEGEMQATVSTEVASGVEIENADVEYNTADAEHNNINTLEDEKVDSSKIKSNVGEAIVDNDYVKIIFNGIEKDGRALVLLSITNKLNEKVVLETNRYFSVNGLSIHPGFYKTLEPNITEEYSIVIGESDLDISYIEKITNIDGRIMVRPETHEKVEEEFSMIPEGVSELDDTQYYAEESDIVLIDNEDYLFVLKGKPIYEDKPALEYYFQNKTDKDIQVSIRGLLNVRTEKDKENISDESAIALAGNGVYDKIVWWSLKDDTEPLVAELAIKMQEEGHAECLFEHKASADVPYVKESE